MLTVNAYAGEVELTTYYPSPQGEYQNLQSEGACVGSDCSNTDMAPSKLKVKGDGEITGDMTVQGKTRVGGSGAKGFVIQRGIPTNPEDGQMWIE